MGIIKRKRLRQVIRYGWKDAGEISGYSDVKKSRISVFIDIWSCFRRYYLFSNHYKNNKFWLVTPEERDIIGKKLGQADKERDEWWEEYFDNRKFLNKYTSRYYETSPRLMHKRHIAYTNRYNLGANCTIQFNVEFSREHQLNGTMKVGNNVLFAKNVFIDYSGEVEIKDNVQLTNSVIIETHYHAFHSEPSLSRDIVMPTKLVIEKEAIIGSRAIILGSCHYIGKKARVGAGSVVTKDVPDYAVVVGAPAKIVRYTNQ